MNNYREVLREVADAAAAAGRNPSDVKLIAVTKTVPWEAAQELYALGQRDFAENRTQNAREKMDIAPNDCRWHLIGTLQSNKVRGAIGRFALIQSVDTPELLKKISDCSVDAGVVTSVLLQVNVSGELTKHGMTPAKCFEIFPKMKELPGVAICGLMTMAPLVDDEGEIRLCFAGLRILRDKINRSDPEANLKELSMGMSQDFKIAIAEGATMVRIGTSLFRET